MNTFTRKLVVGGGAAVGLGVCYAMLRSPSSGGKKGKAGVKKAYQQFDAMMDYPDLSKHNNCLANHLTPSMYKELRDKVCTLYIYPRKSLLPLRKMVQPWRKRYSSSKVQVTSSISPPPLLGK